MPTLTRHPYPRTTTDQRALVAADAVIAGYLRELAGHAPGRPMSAAPRVALAPRRRERGARATRTPAVTPWNRRVKPRLAAASSGEFSACG